MPDVVPEKFGKLAEMVEKRYNLHVRKVTRRELLHEGYGKKFFDIVNATYNELYGYSGLSDGQIDQLVNFYIKIADLNLVTAVEDWNDDHKFVGLASPSRRSPCIEEMWGKTVPHRLVAVAAHHQVAQDGYC